MNPFESVKKMGQRQVNAIVVELLNNPLFLKALERVFTTKEVIDRQSEVVLNAVNIASKLESRELSDRLDQVDRQIRKISKKLEDVAQQQEKLTGELARLNAELSQLSPKSEAPSEDSAPTPES